MKEFTKVFLNQKAFVAVFFGLLALIACPIFAQTPGTTGAVALKIPEGVRPIAMGQAFVAVADDANAVYWNPAGLMQLGGAHVTTEYDVFISTVRYGTIGFGARLSKDFAIGLGGKLLDTGSDPATDGTGAVVPGYVGESYMDIDLAGAYRLSYYLDIGLTAKYITENLSGTTASTFAVDFGLLYRTPIPHLMAGLNIQNIGPGIKFVQVADPLPLNAKVGLAYKMFDDNFTVAYDMNFPIDNAVSANLGGEYWYRDTLVGRFGYQFQGSIDQNDYGIGGKAGLYLGMGVKVAAFKNLNLGLDYAWTDTGILGANHHFAMDFYF